MNHHMVAAAEGRRHHEVKGAAHNYVVTCFFFQLRAFKLNAHSWTKFQKNSCELQGGYGLVRTSRSR